MRLLSFFAANGSSLFSVESRPPIGFVFLRDLRDSARSLKDPRAEAAESAEQAKGAWRAEESVVQFPLVVAGRPMTLPPQKQRLQKSPKRRLTKIRNYGLISYVSQRNSFQGRPADQAGGTGNSPREVCAQSYTSYLSFMSHPCPPANPTPSLKNPAKLPFGSRSNEGE